MTEITTLSQFLTTANTQFHIYDLGRRVQHIDMLAFHQIDSLLAPYPYPIQGHAQFAIVFWQQQQQPYIWFVKLPLDEQGLLSPAPRTQFIKMILEALGRDPTQTLTDEQQEQLANHPFSFKPNQQKLALFNALVRLQLGQAASSQYEFAAQYLSGQAPTETWQQLGLQGLADICVRAHQFDHLNDIINAFENVPVEVQAALCQCLEHITVDTRLAERLFAKMSQAEPDLKVMYLAALASNTPLSMAAIKQLDEQQLLNDNSLITIAARNWLALKDDTCRKVYLEALAKQPQHFFNQVFADIVAIPSLRHGLLSDLRHPERSVQLATAIGGLFKATSL
ncbi:DUF3549 family protein [Shewanella inventionis]|uniref:DUF3549 family protein n=1 Tax=Shewanella inventionis TaxID=1738770 RepID=A0ABQ1JAK5_9GAMM|nr:DUF3549 family protein [Shewanella inventionis]MCL1158626.1 DUF3549 family protein [Shewanella inventionis]UAL45010.1 DUF3549 family protein [Shewanella inventionis]GGB62233.1 hypothetical protein GCM10011607_23750 [Shewanella inventionis]